MTEVQIIVPHNRIAVEVMIDIMPATKRSTLTQPGMGYDVETWAAPSNGPFPRVVTTVFAEKR